MFAGGCGRGCGRLSAGLSAGIRARRFCRFVTVLGPSRSAFRAGPAADLAGTCGGRAVRRRTGEEASRPVVIGVDVGGGDRLALAVLVKYPMATTEQMHWVIAPGVRI